MSCGSAALGTERSPRLVQRTCCCCWQSHGSGQMGATAGGSRTKREQATSSCITRTLSGTSSGGGSISLGLGRAAGFFPRSLGVSPASPPGRRRLWAGSEPSSECNTGHQQCLFPSQRRRLRSSRPVRALRRMLLRRWLPRPRDGLCLPATFSCLCLSGCSGSLQARRGWRPETDNRSGNSHFPRFAPGDSLDLEVGWKEGSGRKARSSGLEGVSRTRAAGDWGERREGKRGERSYGAVLPSRQEKGRRGER